MNHKRNPSGLPHGYILTVSAALKAVFRIRIDFALLDPDPGARKLAKINKSHLAFQKWLLYLRRYDYDIENKRWMENGHKDDSIFRP
jgi:hypothetical protein